MGAGLGNQMNIYASCKTLAKLKNTELKLDITYFDTIPKYKYYEFKFWLGNFNISSKIASKEEVRKYIYKTKFRYINKIFRKLRLFEKNVNEEGFDFNLNNFSDLPDDTYIRGYFGDYRYFDNIKDDLKKEFTLKDEFKKKIQEKLDKIKKENSVSVHIRRGDLLYLKGRSTLPLDYYKKAVDIINKKIKNPQFYVFSDDIPWCKENFKFLGKNTEFCEGNMVEQDFELMKECKHKILANSAFSWWAGYLGQKISSIIISPRCISHIQSDSVSQNIPADWILI